MTPIFRSIATHPHYIVSVVLMLSGIYFLHEYAGIVLLAAAVIVARLGLREAGK